MKKSTIGFLLALLTAWLAGPASGQIVINELMYAPYEPFGTTNATEYIELYNAGTVAVDLGDYRLDNGVEFEFIPGTLLAPDAYLVVCEDIPVFTNAFPAVTNVVGNYKGSLDNGGERVTLSRWESGAWNTVATIKYIDGGPSDGGGTSLELVHPDFARIPDHYAGAWSASLAPTGTPGTVNTVYDPAPAPVIGGVSHSPTLPLPGGIVTVRADVAGLNGDGPPLVQLFYRVDALPQRSWNQRVMVDDGSNGDEIAGDGVYAMQVPGEGELPMEAGDLLEFQVFTEDTGGHDRTAPAINRAGVTSGPYSYLCPFGEDTDFTGEYPTYHILMTELNRSGPSGLETRSDGSDVLLDATFITTGGRVIYNCGTRYRGQGSRKPPYSFRIEFPRGETWKGYQDINFLHNEPLLQYIGMRSLEAAGHGNVGSEVKLCRIWLNETLKSDLVNDQGQGGVYVRIEKVGRDYISKRYPGEVGNIYRGYDDGSLDYRPNLVDYQDGSYGVETNNPFTIWHSLSNLCWILDQDASLFPTILTNRVNVDQWARHYAAQVCLENGEGGLVAARLTKGDDYYVYADPSDGQFDLIPWDFDSLIDDELPEVDTSRSIWQFESNAGNAQPVVSKFLLNPPMISRYVGNILDLLGTTMSLESMAALFDEMGSAVSPAYRAELLDHLTFRRAVILADIQTNFTATVTGALEEGPVVSVVTGTSVSLTGQASQAWTTRVRVNGEEADWDTRSSQWATTSPLTLTNLVNTIQIETRDHEDRVLATIHRQVLVQSDVYHPPGSILTDTTWDPPTGIVHLESDVTVSAAARLTIAPGTVVTLDPDIQIRLATGILDIQGDAGQPVSFYPQDGVSAWSITGFQPGSSVTGQYAYLQGGLITVTNGGSLHLADCEVTGYDGPGDILSTDGATGASLQRCRIADYNATRFRHTPTTIEECLFEHMSDTGIHFLGSTATVRRTTLRSSTPPGSVDGIRLGAASLATITHCLIHDLSGHGIIAGDTPAGPAVATILKAAGGTWKYLDNGSDQGSAWTASGFDDSSWASGAAQLGYGDSDEATVIGFGPDENNKYRTTYFRSTFTVPENWNIQSLTTKLLRDDGGIVYLNGTELFRSNMPEGPVDYLTWAASNVSSTGEDTFYTDTSNGSLMAPGINQLAVEIHQIDADSTDLSFDLELVADVAEASETGGGVSDVSVQDTLVHHCQVGIYGSEGTLFSNQHNTVTACETGLRGPGSVLPELRVRDSYLPDIPVLVRVDMRNDQDEVDRSLWDATATLTLSDPEMTMSTNRIALYNGLGSALVTFSGGGNFMLTATVNGHHARKILLSLEDAPVQQVAGTLPGSSTQWSGVVQVTGDLLVPSGHTLTIDPGTLVLLNGVPSGSGGIDIDVQGALRSLGTKTSPVTLTAADPTEAWGEIHHDQADSSLYQFTMITRAGNAPGGGHTGSGPAIRAVQSTLVMEDSCITDLVGKVMQSTSGSDVTFRNCHLARAVMGPEIDHTAALLEHTWITEMFGSNDNDGIYFHNQQAGQDIIMRNGVNAFVDDDAIDTLKATVRIEQHISRNAFDKGLSVYGGQVTLDRFISADNGIGISIKEEGTETGRIDLDHGTLVGNDIGIQVRDKDPPSPGAFLEYYIRNSIIEPGGVDPVQTDYDPANIHIEYSNVGETWPGTGNLQTGAQFVDEIHRDLQLSDGSPCIDSGDPADPLDADGSRTDMGFYPYMTGRTNVPYHANTIVWDHANSMVGKLLGTWSDIEQEGTNTWPGTANINRNPWFQEPGDADYRLQSISPCLGTASDGGNRGVSFPAGASPTAPSHLTLTPQLVQQTNEVHLAWQDHSTNEEAFEIQRSLDGATWEPIHRVPADQVTAVDADLTQNTWYHYRVRALHNRGESLFAKVPPVLTFMTTSLHLLVDNLRMTEIMYNPSDSTDDVHEFIELKNIGTVPLDLTGVSFDKGLDFSFVPGTTLAPGAFFVLVKDPVAFAARYPAVSWQGVFEGGTGLSNGGETLSLEDQAGNLILEVDYKDGKDAQWYPTTDGDGYALVLNDPDGDPEDASTWRAGSAIHGSPGEEDPPPPYGTILISEVLAHTDPPLEDAIELYNAGTTPVDIADWYLSDDGDNVKKYQITDSSLVIPAGGYTVLYAGTSFHLATNDPPYFAISELGERIYLSSAEGTDLTSYRTWVKFGASDNGVSFGRYRRSDGVEDFVAMSAHTFGVAQPLTVAQFRTGTGLANAYPSVGPVVINEIMYNPSATGKEFIELSNISGAQVPLFDPANPTHCWALDGAVDFTFPTNTWIDADEQVLIVSIEPELFRAQYGLTNQALQVFGPFDGALANDGESVKLYKPGGPEPDGFVPQIRVDRVKYDDEAPWPVAADNGGPSLERIDAHLYGNDPINWAACSVGGTPGAANNTTCLPSVGFTRTRDSGWESNGTMSVAIRLIPPVPDTVTVRYVVGGTATAGVDYFLEGGTAVFWPHDTNQVLTLSLLDDGATEYDETVVISLTEVSSNARLGGNSTYTYTLIDTDATDLTAPVILPAGTNTFVDSVLVTVTSAMPNVQTYYTLDGSVPTDVDHLYAAPFALPYSARVTARTYIGEANTSDSTSALFLEQRPLGPPRVDNLPGANLLGLTTAQLNGHVVSTGQAPTRVTAYWGESDGGNTATAWAHHQDLGLQSVGPLAQGISGLQPDTTYHYRFYGTNDLGDHWAAPSASFATISGKPTVQNACGAGGVPVPFSRTNILTGAVWQYLDDGSDQGTAWAQPDFDADAWATGAAQLGYGDNDEVTVIGFGPDADNKYTTSYFRHAFPVVSTNGITGITVRLLRDDGAVVYLNGTELFRDNIPTDPIDSSTFAEEVTGGDDEDQFFTHPASSQALIEGTNVLAVEVHQVNLGSSDLGFDLEFISHGINVVGSSASNLTATSAMISGELISTGAAPSAVRVHWGRIDGGNMPTHWVHTSSLGAHAEGPVDATLLDLLPGATYYYRFGASNVFGSAIADCAGMFTTPFPDTDGDGLLDDWELEHFGDLVTSAGTDDVDGDGVDELGEQAAGTQPTNDTSLLRLTMEDNPHGAGVLIRWPSAPERLYDVSQSTNLPGSWQVLTGDLFAVPPQNVYTGTVESVNHATFRVRVK